LPGAISSIPREPLWEPPDHHLRAHQPAIPIEAGVSKRPFVPLHGRPVSEPPRQDHHSRPASSVSLPNLFTTRSAAGSLPHLPAGDFNACSPLPQSNPAITVLPCPAAPLRGFSPLGIVARKTVPNREAYLCVPPDLPSLPANQVVLFTLVHGSPFRTGRSWASRPSPWPGGVPSAPISVSGSSLQERPFAPHARRRRPASLHHARSLPPDFTPSFVGFHPAMQGHLPFVHSSKRRIYCLHQARGNTRFTQPTENSPTEGFTA
jgi:hypothetical protein